MVRATTGGVMKTYRSNLMNSFINMNANRNTVLSQRTFNSFAEDPAAAARAFRLRKSRMTVESQHNICTDVMKKYETAFSCLQSNDDVLCTKEGVYGEYMKTLTGTTLKMLNDPTGDARTQLSKVLDQMSQTLVQTMNQKYGDNFIFAGADGHNVPFEIRDDGKLYYRGVWVDAAPANVLRDANGEPIMMGEGGRVNPSGAYYLKMDNVEAITQAEYDKLKAKAAPQTYADLSVDDTTEVDAEGNISPGGGYYRLKDEAGNPTDQLISVADYNSDQPVEYNADGTLKGPDGEGGYYKRTDTDGLITKAESEEAADKLGNLLQDKAKNAEYIGKDKNGDPVYYVVDGDPKEQLMTQKEYDAQKLEADKLKFLADEKCFVDIGLGFQEDDKGNLIESSAFNSALNGLNFLGYGVDEDGDPKNLYSLVQKMREVADSVNGDKDWDTATWDEFDRLVSKFEAGVSDYQTEFANLAASTTKLKNQQELLEDNFYNLQEQYSDLEDVDMVDAITSFIWAEYCYNAALKVGNSILSESLMDYLR